MPIFSYFAVVGSVLVGLLFLTNAVLPARGPLSVSTEFRGVSATLHGVSAGALRDPTLVAPAPDMRSEAVKLASQGAPEPAVNVEPVNQPSVKAAPAPKKHKRVVRARQWQDQYAQAQDPGWNWGSNNRFNEQRWGSDWGFHDRRWR